MKKRWLMVAIMVAVLVLGGCGKSEVEKLKETYEEKLFKVYEKVQEAEESGSASEVEQANEELNELAEEYIQKLQKTETEKIGLTLKTIGADTLQTPDTVKVRAYIPFYSSEPVVEFKTDECQTCDFELIVGMEYSISAPASHEEDPTKATHINSLTKDDDGRVIVVDYEKQEIYFEDEAGE